MTAAPVVGARREVTSSSRDTSSSRSQWPWWLSVVVLSGLRMMLPASLPLSLLQLSWRGRLRGCCWEVASKSSPLASSASVKKEPADAHLSRVSSGALLVACAGVECSGCC